MLLVVITYINSRLHGNYSYMLSIIIEWTPYHEYIIILSKQ
jgi:hypothetical protein